MALGSFAIFLFFLPFFTFIAIASVVLTQWNNNRVYQQGNSKEEALRSRWRSANKSPHFFLFSTTFTFNMQTTEEEKENYLVGPRRKRKKKKKKKKSPEKEKKKKKRLTAERFFFFTR